LSWFKHILFVLSLGLCISGKAQPFSYVYILGDKITPFYVKIKDHMLPRYGKNYCIISELNPGPIRIQVLFQQHAYPPQEFTINVPYNGNRAFLLNRQGNSFALYDLQQKKYLPQYGEQ
jgi:hypothetical protein